MIDEILHALQAFQDLLWGLVQDPDFWLTVSEASFYVMVGSGIMAVVLWLVRRGKESPAETAAQTSIPRQTSKPTEAKPTPEPTLMDRSKRERRRLYPEHSQVSGNTAGIMTATKDDTPVSKDELSRAREDEKAAQVLPRGKIEELTERQAREILSAPPERPTVQQKPKPAKQSNSESGSKPTPFIILGDAGWRLDEGKSKGEIER